MLRKALRGLIVSSALITALLLGIAAAQGPQQAPANTSGEKDKEKARVEGTVLSSTGEPIARATVRLQPSTPPALGGPALPAAATAGQDGVYILENVEPGTYTLTAQRPGFVNTTYGQRRPNTPGTPIVLAAGQAQKGLDITMIPQGVISGRITDANGDTLQGVQVMALRSGYQRGVRVLMPAGTASSNDLGEYRIANLPPGQYTVAAVDRRAIALAQINAAPDTSGGREGNVTTYYPNATDPKAAAPVTITPGADLRGTDIRLRSGKIFSISGKAIGPGGAPASSVILAVTPSDTMSAGTTLLTALSRTTMQVRPDGSFSGGNLPPGKYTIMALSNVVLNGQPAPNMTGRAEFTISDSDLNDVVFNLGEGASISGTVTLDGGVPIKTLFDAAGPGNANASPLTAIAAAAAGVTVAGLRPTVGLMETAGQLGNPPAGRVNEDGTFTISGIGPSRFGLIAGGLPQGYYVKSARLGGADVLKTGLDFSSGGGGEMIIVLSNKSATVTGVVRDMQGEAQSGQVVALWTAEPDFGSQTNGVRNTYTDQNGTFRFANLPPGEYFVAAFEDAEPGQVQNRELLKLALADAEELKLEESGNAAEELKAISAEALEQYMAKLP